MAINIDLSNISSFVGSEEITSHSQNYSGCLDSLLKGNGMGSEFLGWITLPEDIEPQISMIEKTAARLRAQAAITVVIGIGGSYLGARAIIEALSEEFTSCDNHRIIYAGHQLSESYLSSLTQFIAGKPFNIIVISKSGTTTEPAIAFRVLRKLLEEVTVTGNTADHIVAITDRSKGALRQMADLEGYQTYVIPDEVGGRYSVLTPVGLLPVATAGFNIRNLVEGAASMAVLTRDNNNPEVNMAVKYATIRNLLYKKGKRIEMLVNYEPRLHYIGEWWKQLFGESEGKGGLGIFPAAADLTTDLHSLGQYIQDGERIIFETVLSIAESPSRLTVPFDHDNHDGINFISGLPLSEVNARAEQGTIQAHNEGGVPVIRIVLPGLNEKYIGQLIYFFELSCALSGYMLGINPFDQPGVEAYKRNMFRLLGKAGY